MQLSNLYNNIALISPWCEVMLRHIYWKYYSLFKKYNPYRSTHKLKKQSNLNFQSIIDYLSIQGIGKGDLIVVHSSYDSLEQSGLSPNEIIDQLLSLVGPTGTLAMPVIRKFKGEPKQNDILSTDISDLVCTYNVKKTVVTSGMLPYTMLQRNESIVSHFPLNPMVAIGPLAKDMMQHNLDGEYPSPHGLNSSWKFCLDHNAYIVSLGVELNHHNTMMHVAEEAFGDWRWSDEEWYNLRKFNIIDENKDSKLVVVKERKPQWGMLRIASLNLANDLDKKNIIKRKYVTDDVVVCVEKSQELIKYLRNKNQKGYPYYKF